jgi:cytoskeletal protein RodZ
MDAGEFGRFLHSARERRGLTLTDVSTRTRIPVRHFESLERGNVAMWPKGMYRRAMVRAYAECVGLDPANVVRHFMRIYGEATVAPEYSADSGPKPQKPSIPVSLVATLLLFLFGSVAVALILVMVGRSGEPRAAAASQQLPASPSAADKPLLPAATEATKNTVDLATSGTATEEIDDIEGELVVSSEPSGARVTVNGIGWGTTPIRIKYLPLGDKEVRLTKDGYLSQERSVRLDASRPRGAVAFKLRQRN